MKTILTLSMVLLLNLGLFGSNLQKTQGASNSEGTLTILSSAELYPVTSLWAAEYNATNPTFKVELVQTDVRDAMNAARDNRNYLYFASEDEVVDARAANAWKMVVGRDVVVPVISSRHPYLNEIYEHGVSANALMIRTKNPENNTWRTVLSDGYDAPMNIYVMNEALVQNSVREFLAVESLEGSIKKLNNKNDLMETLKNDPYAIVFCTWQTMTDAGNQNVDEGLALLPIDVNGNNRLDQMENVYHTLAGFQRSIWIGKYPKALIHNMYAVADYAPNTFAELDFLQWVVRSGEASLQANGYLGLVSTEMTSKLSKLQDAPLVIEPTPDTYSKYRLLMLIVGLAIVVALFLELGYRRNRRNQSKLLESRGEDPKVINVNSMSIPQGVYYDKSHTWAIMEKDGFVRIGIDDFLQRIIGPISRTILKSEGARVKKGEVILKVVQNGKQLNIKSPISGRITKFNSELMINPDQLNVSPYAEGWVYLVEPSNWLREIQFMNMAAKYKEWLASEFVRLKDFIAHSSGINQSQLNPIILQDGGELVENVLSEFGPEVWADFQTHFLDAAE